MNEEAKKLEACGDGLLLAVARFYLRDRHRAIPYHLYARLVALMVCNRTLARIAEAEGIKGTGESRTSAADALEMEIAARYYRDGYAGARRWLWSIFDKHLDIEAEARRLTDPTHADKLRRSVRGALKSSLQVGAVITDKGLDAATRQIVEQLQNGQHPT